MKLASPEVAVEKRGDGSLLLRSPQKLGSYPRCVTEWLVEWSDRAPTRAFLCERAPSGGWKSLTYREAFGAVRRVGQYLLDKGFGQNKPVAILSDNSIDHALLALGAMHVGVPVAPVSPAYSLMSKDFGKLKMIFELLQPGLVWTADPQKFGPALAAVGAKSASLPEILETNPGSTQEREFFKLRKENIAKILFTSG